MVVGINKDNKFCNLTKIFIISNCGKLVNSNENFDITKLNIDDNNKKNNKII